MLVCYHHLSRDGHLDPLGLAPAALGQGPWSLSVSLFSGTKPVPGPHFVSPASDLGSSLREALVPFCGEGFRAQLRAPVRSLSRVSVSQVLLGTELDRNTHLLKPRISRCYFLNKLKWSLPAYFAFVLISHRADVSWHQRYSLCPVTHDMPSAFITTLLQSPHCVKP